MKQIIINSFKKSVTMTITAYTPVYWDGSMPAPTGIFSQDIHAREPPAAQRDAAIRLQTFLKGAATEDLGYLAGTRTPAPMLLQVPGTNKVRFITGLAPFLGDPLAPPSPLSNTLLALDQDIDHSGEPPKVMRLPNDTLKIQRVLAPEISVVVEDLKDKKEDEGKAWYTEATVRDKTHCEVAKTVPCPAYVAYDAFVEDVSAVILLERILTLQNDTNTDEVKSMWDWVITFLCAVLTKHNTKSNTVQIPHEYFAARQHKDAKTWGKDRVNQIYPSLKQDQASGQNMSTSTIQELLALLQASTRGRGHNPQAAPTQDEPRDMEDPYAATCKKFNMAEPDLRHTLLLCGLEPGDEEYLPTWYTEIAVKNISTEGKGRIIRSLFTDLTYDEHPIPALPTTVTMLTNKAWVGNDPSNTAQATMKGLSPYICMPRSEADVQAASELHNATSEATTKTKEDVLTLAKQVKPATPRSFSSLIGTLRTFANPLGICFGKRSPLYVDLVSDVIAPLAQWTETAKGAVAPATLAAIMWAIFQQARHFAQGNMQGTKKKYTAEWKVMLLSIESASNFTLLNCPASISGNLPNPPSQGGLGTDGANKRKAEVEDGEKPSGSPSKQGKRSMEIHPLIKKHVTSILPPKISVSEICKLCNTSANKIFPGTRVCVNGALKGHCGYRQCYNKHDASLVTDEIAKIAISVLDPIIKNPKSMQPSG